MQNKTMKEILIILSNQKISAYLKEIAGKLKKS